MNETELDPKVVIEQLGFKAEPPYHRWPSNEDLGRAPQNDRCLRCQVHRFSDNLSEVRVAQAPCSEADYPVPGHINDVTGSFCNTEGTLARGGRCPDGCDHAPHYSNDGHEECVDESGMP